MDNENKNLGEPENDQAAGITENEAEQAEDTEAVSAEETAAEETAADNGADEDSSEEDVGTADKKDVSSGKKSKINLRKLKYGSIATAITVVVIAIVVMINIVVGMASEKVNMSIDLTENGNFEISQETKDYLATVNEPVEIVCLSDEATFKNSAYVYYKQAYEVLRKYTIYSDNITLKFVDMVKNPTYVEKYKSSYKGEIDAYSIIIESAKRIKVITIQDLYNVEMNYQTFQQEIVSSKAEQELTSALMYVTDPDPLSAVVFNVPTQGSSYDNVKSLLVSNGYDVTEIDPLSEEIPEDTDLIVINAPLNDFDNDLIDKLYAFLDNGGRLGKNLIYIADYQQKETANIDAFLAEWGIEVGNGVVGDDDTANLSTQSYYIIRDYIQSNDYSLNVAEPSLPVIDYMSRPINLLFDNSDTRETVSLLNTSSTGFVLTDDMRKAAENGEEVTPEHGVYNTIALGRKYVFDSENQRQLSSVLVVGSSETLDEQFTSTTYFNNGEYFISILNSMTGKNTGISIVAKDLSGTTYSIDQQTVGTYYTIFVIIIPALVILMGVLVFIRRRSK